MPIDVRCPTCSEPYQVKDDAAGRRFRCRKCDGVVDVPTGSATFTAESPFEDEHQFSPGPRESARHASGGIPRRRRQRRNAANAVDRVKPPAIAMMVIGIIGILAGLFYAGMGIVAATAGGPEEVGAMVIMGILGGAILISSSVMTYAGYQMFTLGSWGMALTGSILMVVPVCSPCGLISIGIGVWCLVVVNDVDVKAAFHHHGSGDGMDDDRAWE